MKALWGCNHAQTITQLLTTINLKSTRDNVSVLLLLPFSGFAYSFSVLSFNYYYQSLRLTRNKICYYY